MTKNMSGINILLIFLMFVCFLTNLSQLPYLIENEFSRIISIWCWVLMAFLCMFNGIIRFNRDIILPILASVFLFIWLLLLSVFTDNEYLNTSLFYGYRLSIFIFFIGFWCSKKISYDNLFYVLAVYVISTLIVTINIYLSNLQGLDLTTSSYLYSSKNSVSQIIFTALVFLFIVYYPGNIKSKIIKWAIISFFTTVLLLLKSRATILGIVIMIFLTLLYSKASKDLKLTAGFIAVIFTLLLNNEYFYETIINGIFFMGRDPLDFDAVSSGRWDQILEFPNLIDGNEILGIGNYYIESFPLDAWLQYGYFFGSVFILISLWPVVWGLRNLPKNNKVNVAFIIIACSYWVNGLFEQLAPFGPGVKCYMLWLLFGILLGNKSIGKENKQGFTHAK